MFQKQNNMNQVAPDRCENTNIADIGLCACSKGELINVRKTVSKKQHGHHFNVGGR
jgi:hypothetical protein